MPGSTKLHKRKRGEPIPTFASTTAEVAPAVRSILEQKLHGEFELYKFVLQRLKYQLAV